MNMKMKQTGYLPKQNNSKTVEDAIKEGKDNQPLSTDKNTELTDTKGNKIVVPAGFKVTEDATTVDQGIVIEDVTSGAAAGSQFVWIPVGKITKEDGTTVDIKLNRYTFDSDGKETPQNESVVWTYFSETASKGNIVAKSISNFKSSVTTNGGYYIGRYEARTPTSRSDKEDVLTQITEKGTDQVYNYVTQLQAAQQAQGMYTSNNFTSDLMNSYAWDTATLFLQSCGTNSKYSIQNSLNTLLSQTGTNALTEINKIDKQCNVYDMASNVREWTTETSSYSDAPCSYRGGVFDNSDFCVSGRNGSYTFDSFFFVGFRPILYLQIIIPNFIMKNIHVSTYQNLKILLCAYIFLCYHNFLRLQNSLQKM